MALHKGKLFAGALFAGALFGAQEQQPNTHNLGGGGGGGFGWPSRAYVPTPKDRHIEVVVKANHEQDDEEVVVMLLVELIAKGVIS